MEAHCKLYGVGAALEVVVRSQCSRSVPRSPWSQLADTALRVVEMAHESYTGDLDVKEVWKAAGDSLNA